MLPTHHVVYDILGDEFVLQQGVKDVVLKAAMKLLYVNFWQRMECAIGIKCSVESHGVDMGVEVEQVPSGVEGCYHAGSTGRGLSQLTLLRYNAA
jgi:hypothetical protein